MNETQIVPDSANDGIRRLSIVVVIVSDTTDRKCDLSHLQGCLQSLLAQECSQELEIIVPYYAGLSGIDELCRQYPSVRFLPCHGLKSFTGRGGCREHHDELRARGIAAANGQLVGLLEDHARPVSEWAEAMSQAHRGMSAGIGGPIDNGVNRLLNWAVYFCDFGKYQTPLPTGPAMSVSDANVSYKRSALDAIRTVWQDSFHETRVNWELMSRGAALSLCSKAVVFQCRLGLRLRAAAKERYIWGRSYAATRGRTIGRIRRYILTALSPVLPVLLAARMTSCAFRRKRHFVVFVKAFPLTVLLTTCWSFGECMGYLTGRTGPTPEPLVRESIDAAVATR